MDGGTGTFSGCEILRSIGFGLSASNSVVALIINTTIANTTLDDINVDGDSHITALNTTFATWAIDDPISSITVQWYLDVYVVDEAFAPVPGTNVWVNDTFAAPIFTGVTDGSGYCRWIVCTEYVRDLAGRTEHTPHWIEAANATHYGDGSALMDSSYTRQIQITAPVIDILVEKQVWNSTSGAWVDMMFSLTGAVERFNISIQNTGNQDLEHVEITDFLPEWLNYMNSATVNGLPYEPDWMDLDMGILQWDIWAPGMPLAPGEWLYLEFDVLVNNTGYHYNWVEVTGWAFSGSDTEEEANATIIVASYRGDLIFEHNHQLIGDDIYEYPPVTQVVPRGIVIGEVQVWNFWVQNDGNVNDLITLMWDNSTMPFGWDMWITYLYDDNGTEVPFNITANGSWSGVLSPWQAAQFVLTIYCPPSASVGDQGQVDLEVSDSGVPMWHDPDGGVAVAITIAPDSIRIGDWDDELQAYSEMPDLEYPVSVSGDVNGPFYAFFWNSTFDMSTGQLVEVWWNYTNADGASGWCTPNGTNMANETDIHTGDTTGNLTFHASYWNAGLGTWWNDTWIVYITIGWDELNLTYTPGGVEIPGNETAPQDIFAGTEVTFYDSIFNHTSGYVCLAPTGDVVIEGGSAHITAWGWGVFNMTVGNTLGLVYVNVSVDFDGGIWYNDTVVFNVLAPTPDIFMEKKVWNSKFGIWDDLVFSDEGFVERMNISIQNTGEAVLTNVVVTDVMSNGLLYWNNAMVNGIPYEPDWMDAGGQIFQWHISWDLAVGEWLYIEFDVYVDQKAYLTNWADASGSSAYDGTRVNLNDTATVISAFYRG
ncbi:MAG: DUF11 domain-containing protein, partial [Thermoplasmata archaeon]|nr:DUF11 domain-containing protein [Thermoplasmata archaeon]